ncbi:putative E3 ubiquitin-protein ligase HERC6 [Astyanax mexicanus]|uniref:Putative E3 ubiquitin-protein ligase HERC6 n=1 Tax=Astyanax mexicanus TaxID=7994 RepID=A0A8T2M1Y6_ASTMX|nr:putative E3 ubiquitin-protein ligase HERC6 [Astyanax mexicanus]
MLSNVLTGQVYSFGMFCWGDASRGQLLLPAAEGHYLPKPTFISIITEPVVGVSCGENHSLIVAENGRVFSCGRNSKGQLGRAKSKDTKQPVIEGLGGVAAVACGQEHSLALCDSGQVFSWGAGGEGQLGLSTPVSKSSKPVLIQIPMILPIPVVQIACGNIHSLALTKGGEVFSWGQNSYGQLGLGKSVPLQPVPAVIPALIGVPVIQISAGGEHTLALSCSGQVFCCGANSAGQLGLNRTDEKGRFGVCAVPALRRLPVAYISCGAAHTAVLTKDGEVYTFGDGAHGQLGHSSTSRELLPRKVEDIDGPAKQVTCGSHHTLVLMSSGVLYAFGHGVRGQLGNGSGKDSLQPVRLDELWKDLAVKIQAEMRISSGWNSNFLFFPPPKPSVLEEPIGRLDDARVQRWVSMLERDRTTEIAKREISLTFSTCSNIVACFLKESGAIGKSNFGTMAVDLDAASQTFDKLVKIPWIKKSINLKPLVRSLWYGSAVMKCPEIFLLLPTCPILHEEQNTVEFVLPIAVALTKLNETAMKILKEHWSAMDAPMMIKHISMWKSALSFLLKAKVWLNFIPGVKGVLEVLKYLYRSNKRVEKSRKVPISEFYIEEIGNVELLLQQDITLWRQIKWGQVEEMDMTPPVFCRYPFLLDLQSKIRILNYDSAITKMTHHVIHNQVKMGLQPELFNLEAPLPIMLLKLRRTALLEDTFRHLSYTDHDNFKKELMVHFVEDSRQTAVNQRDFFLHVFTELIAPESEMFIYNDSQTMIWFPSKPKLESKKYFLFGILCGLALNNSNIVHMPFPLAMFKKLVNVKPTLDDLIEFRPVIGESLRYLLYDYTDDDVENMELSFCIHWDGVDVELDPQERGKLVSRDNKKKFVDAYVDYTMNKSVEQVFEEFRRGFYKVCDRDVVEFFQPEELRGVMVGTEEYDWDVFRQNTAYNGQYHTSHPTIITFWEVFEELTEEQKKAFLLFLTGCDRVPILGMEQVKMTVSVLLNSTQEHLPESLTCHCLLMLPEYESKQRLQDKLVEALNHNRGFWRE